MHERRSPIGWFLADPVNIGHSDSTMHLSSFYERPPVVSTETQWLKVKDFMINVDQHNCAYVA